jgi:hypothetical protein
MSSTERFTGRRYEIVAFAYGERPLYYREFDDDGGIWLLLTRPEHGRLTPHQGVLFEGAEDRDEGTVFKLYRGDVGYRCECGNNYDAFSRAFDDWPKREFDPEVEVVTREQAVAFVRAHNYAAFLDVPAGVMRGFCEARTLSQILPANFRGPQWWREYLDEISAEMITSLKIEMGWPLIVDDVFDVPNQEIRSRALDVFGRLRFVHEAGAEVVDRHGESELLRVRDMVFVHVTDASTPRRYLLRVPPRMRTVREAIAWTFRFNSPDDYAPTRET